MKCFCRDKYDPESAKKESQFYDNKTICRVGENLVFQDLSHCVQRLSPATTKDRLVPSKSQKMLTNKDVHVRQTDKLSQYKEMVLMDEIKDTECFL